MLERIKVWWEGRKKVRPCLLEAVRQLVVEGELSYGLTIHDRAVILAETDPRFAWARFWLGSAASVYPVLRRLESDGLLVSWTDGKQLPKRGGRPRVFYSPTAGNILPRA